MRMESKFDSKGESEDPEEIEAIQMNIYRVWDTFYKKSLGWEFVQSFWCAAVDTDKAVAEGQKRFGSIDIRTMESSVYHYETEVREGFVIATNVENVIKHVEVKYGDETILSATPANDLTEGTLKETETPAYDYGPDKLVIV